MCENLSLSYKPSSTIDRMKVNFILNSNSIGKLQKAFHLKNSQYYPYIKKDRTASDHINSGLEK